MISVLQFIQQQLMKSLKQKVRFAVYLCIQCYTVEKATITPPSSGFLSRPAMVIVEAVHFFQQIFYYTCFTLNDYAR